MSISSLEHRYAADIPFAFQSSDALLPDTPMTLQQRIRFECFLIVGHAGVCLEFQCLPQAPFELERDGPRTTQVFANRLDRCLQSAHTEAEFGGPIPWEIRSALRAYVFRLDDNVSRDIDFRMGHVSLSGRTFCDEWRASA